jgi:uncharacterized membrane protein
LIVTVLLTLLPTVKEVRKMKKKIIFLISCILSILLIISCAGQKMEQVPPANQEKCEGPSYREGDSWKFVYSGGGQWEETIISNGNMLDLRQNPKQGIQGIINFPIVGRKIFPLWVGKICEGVQPARSVDGIDLNYFYSYTTLGIVNEKVEAGTFKCYKIEFKIRCRGGEGTMYLYYSPETKSIIKCISYGGLLHQFSSYTLLAYSLK